MLATAKRTNGAKSSYPQFAAQPDWAAVRAAAEAHAERQTVLPAIFALMACFSVGRFTQVGWRPQGALTDAEYWLGAFGAALRAAADGRCVPNGLHPDRSKRAVDEYHRLMQAAGLGSGTPDVCSRDTLIDVLTAGMVEWIWFRNADRYVRAAAGESWLRMDRNSAFQGREIVAALPFHIPAKDADSRGAVFLSFVLPLTPDSLVRAGRGRIKYESVYYPRYDTNSDKVTRREVTECYVDGRLAVRRDGADVDVEPEDVAEVLIGALLAGTHNDSRLWRIAEENAGRLVALGKLGLPALAMSEADLRAHYRKAIGSSRGLKHIEVAALRLPHLDPAKVAEALGERRDPSFLTGHVDIAAVARLQKERREHRLESELAVFERTIATVLTTWRTELNFVLPILPGSAELARGPVELIQDNSVVLKAAGNPRTWGVRGKKNKSLCAVTFGGFELELSAVYGTDGKLRLVASVNVR